MRYQVRIYNATSNNFESEIFDSYEEAAEKFYRVQKVQTDIEKNLGRPSKNDVCLIEDFFYKIETEEYDNSIHIVEPPYGVQSYPLFDGELLTSIDYEWILLNNFGTPIITSASYSEGDLGSNKYSDEDVLKHIKYLLKHARFKEVGEWKAEEICRLLGEETNTQEDD